MPQVVEGIAKFVKRNKEISVSGWETVLKNFTVQFLSEYYNLPAGEEQLDEFLANQNPPQQYQDIRDRYHSSVPGLLPIMNDSLSRLREYESKLSPRKRQKRKHTWYGTSDELKLKTVCLKSFCEFLANPAAPTTMFIDRQLRNLYEFLPDTHLPYGFNAHHDFNWRGFSMGKDQREYFVIRGGFEHGKPHPVTGQLVEIHGSGFPIPNVPETRIRRGNFRSDDWFDGIIVMDLLYWHEITIKSFGRESLKKRDQKPVHVVYVKAEEDPEKYAKTLLWYGRIIKNVYHEAKESLPLTP